MMMVTFPSRVARYARGDRPNEMEINHGRASGQNTLNLFRKGAVGFIDWLDLFDKLYCNRGQAFLSPPMWSTA